MFTWSTKDLSIQSRIDFWLISEDMADKVDTDSIEPSILTDHKGISIKINMHGLSTKKVSKGYWKMNKTLLEKEVAGINDKYWNCACVMNSFGSYWELMKFD
jgi:dimeric dUTPase (all-alpha-NTP-PPase superfamily)